MKAKNIYTLLFSVIALMLVGILTLNDEAIILEPSVNLLVPPADNSSVTIAGITISNVNNEYVFNGTSTASVYFSFNGEYASSTNSTLIYDLSNLYTANAETYTMSFSYVSGTMSVGAGFIGAWYSSVGYDIRIPLDVISASDSGLFKATGYELGGWIQNGAVLDNYTIDIQFEIGGVSNDYVNYIDTTEIVTVSTIDTYTNKIISASGVIIGLVVLVTIVVPIISGKKEND